MRSRFVLLLTFLCFGLNIFQARADYEYWLDDDYTNRIKQISSEEDISLSIDVSSLRMGIHFFSFRARNTNGEYGTLNRYIFFVPDVLSTTSPEDSPVLSDCEYWIDDDYANRTVTTVSEENTFSIDVSSLRMGIHFFSFRARNSNGEYGTLNRYIFFVPDVPSTTSPEDSPVLSDCEYWIDDDYANRTVTTVSEENTFSIDVSSLRMGIHFFSFRARNSNGEYGTLNRYIFFVPDVPSTTSPEDSPVLSDCEYWIDDDYANRTVTTVSEENTFSIDVSSLRMGIHFFSFRARNSNGEYGTLNRYIFFVPDVPSTDQDVSEEVDLGLDGYSYSFNNKETYVSVTGSEDSIVWYNHHIPLPNIREVAKIDNTCVYTFADQSDEVTMNRTTEITFSIRFHNKFGEYSMPEVAQYMDSDRIVKTAHPVELHTTVNFDKTIIGDYEAITFDVAEAGRYWFRSEEPCSMDIYRASGERVVVLQQDALSQAAPANLDAGKYFGIVYNMVRDEQYASEQTGISFMSAPAYAPAPVITYVDEVVTMTSELEGALIHYTLDGSTPTEESTLYEGPFELKHNAIIRAKSSFRDLADSFISSLVVDSYKVATPVIEFLDLEVHIECDTPESQIFYTTDGSDPDTHGILYAGPFALLQNSTVKAVGKRDWFNTSDIAELEIMVSEVTCGVPVFSVEDDVMTISTSTEDAAIYYTTDGSDPDENATEYVAPIILEHNQIIRAIALKDGFMPSDIRSYDVDWFKVETPVLSFADSILTISCSTPDVVIYYTIGEEQPDRSSEEYTSPLVLSDNRMIRAFAVKPDFHDSDVAEFTPDTFMCKMPMLQFDGRYVTLSTTTYGADIYYTFDGDDPEAEFRLYSGKTELPGICTIKAVARKQDVIDSDDLIFDVPCFYDGVTASVAEAGSLSRAFGWTDINVIEDLCIDGELDASDFEFLRSCRSLSHLDIGSIGVKGKVMPDGALSGMNLVCVTMPESTDIVSGRNMLADCGNLGAIIWNKHDDVPDDILGGASMPNLLLYVRGRGYVSTSFVNVVVNHYASTITLAEGAGVFYCPEQFTAENISYVHSFAQTTEIGQCRGWETLSLPFAPTSFVHEVNGAIVPFGIGEPKDRHFWLRELTESGFVQAVEMKANTPYILSMPNNDEYADEYIQAGNVMFSATNAEVLSSDELHPSFMGDFCLMPSFLGLYSDDAYALNVGEEYRGHSEGSVFARGLRKVLPFEAYILRNGSNSPEVRDDIFEIDGENQETVIEMLKCHVDITDMKFIYNLNGLRMDMEFDELPAGIYVIGRKVRFKE